MVANVGGADRVIRAVLGVAIIAAGLYYRSWWGLIGIPVLLTAVFRFCLAYIPLKISTSKPAPAQPPEGV